ncbi:MAG: cbb3-type cytochrome c oxidase subunit 3 [Rhodospirillaceae bacterium]|nr:cbb3-type cytochrome c oxidase subunit 3 [Rhodospirillaceae bacterium]
MSDLGLDHDSLVAFAKSWGLLYLLALSVGVLAYTFWPGSTRRFDRAAKSIMDDENGPCA